MNVHELGHMLGHMLAGALRAAHDHDAGGVGDCVGGETRGRRGRPRRRLRQA